MKKCQTEERRLRMQTEEMVGDRRIERQRARGCGVRVRGREGEMARSGREGGTKRAGDGKEEEGEREKGEHGT